MQKLKLYKHGIFFCPSSVRWSVPQLDWSCVLRGLYLQQLGRLGSRGSYRSGGVPEPSCWQDPYCTYVYMCIYLPSNRPLSFSERRAGWNHWCCLCSCEFSVRCECSVCLSVICVASCIRECMCGMQVCSVCVCLQGIRAQPGHWWDLWHGAAPASAPLGCWIQPPLTAPITTDMTTPLGTDGSCLTHLCQPSITGPAKKGKKRMKGKSWLQKPGCGSSCNHQPWAHL